MANVLGNYNEIFFAQQALIQLEKALGMASRVHRGYEEEATTPRVRGDTIQIRRPGVFTVVDAPAVAQDIVTESVSITLNRWKETKGKLTDKELSLSNEKIVTDHIRPMAVALADFIDQDLAALYYGFPWQTIASATPGLTDLTAARKLLFDNKVPIRDGPQYVHGMVDSGLEMGILNALSASGMQPTQQDTAVRAGNLGTLYNIEWFANQNTPTHTGSTQTDLVGTGTGTAGNSTLSVAALAVTTTYKKGDIFTLAGDSQPYTFGADFTTDGAGAAAGVTLGAGQKLKTSPAGAVLTITAGTTVIKSSSLVFHRNAIALAMAPLSQRGAELGGAKIATVQDPITGLAIRFRMYYVGNSSEVHMAMDALWGVQVLDPNLGMRVRAN